MNLNIVCVVAWVNVLNALLPIGIPSEGLEALGRIDIEHVFDLIIVFWTKLRIFPT